MVTKAIKNDSFSKVFPKLSTVSHDDHDTRDCVTLDCLENKESVHVQAMRHQMKKKVCLRLRQSCARSRKEVNNNLTVIASILEDHLFRSASTWDEYWDVRTLQHRLLTLMNICKRNGHDDSVPNFKHHVNDGHDDNDCVRNKMKLRIKTLIEEKVSNKYPEQNIISKTRLVEMADTVEDYLYHSSPSLEVYSDERTLKSRLQRLAMKYSTR
jgi:hypothetical protein